MIESQKMGSEALTKTKERNQNKLERLNEDFSSQYSQESQNRQEMLDMQKQQAKDELAKTAHRNQEQVGQVRARGERSLKTVQSKYKDNLERQTKIGEDRISEQKGQTEKRLEYERSRGELAVGKTQEVNEKRIEQTTNLGDKRVNESKDSVERKLAQIDASSKRELSQRDKAFNERKKDQEQEFHNSFSQNKDAYSKNLKRQQEQFKWSYNNNARAQKESVNIQKEMLTKQLAQNQAEILGKVNHYQEIKADPFYRIEDRGTKLQETNDSYILTTYVPSHEKDNVKIKVHHDHAAVEGVRSFADKREEEDRKLSTHSYQTFREEFKFENPVVPEAIEKTRSGDYVRVEIPKMASRPNKA
jgi:HSP20 family molecular chaperone IbpA